ncbi:MAG TPA: hypothetical protein VJB99_03760, partial [Patescibacteria group bacterium]|nr:hypothetical protein [Patescibacteria group bacterium]
GNAYDFVVPSDGVCSGSNAVVCDADADCGGSETCIIAGNLDPLALTNGWQLYELGPLDTTTLSDFDDTAVLRFGGNSGATFYLDNVQLKAAQENRTLVKDSWTTPSVCDQTPAGTAAPQYYLGCEAYTDETRTQTPLYQFRQLCSESKVGCSAFFATQNDGTPHERVFNATCSLGADVVTTPTPCVVNAISVCTVPSGSNRCLFSWDAPLSRPLPAQVTFGPETVVVSADQAVYLVANESASCSQGEAGCTELGTPVFSQDQSVVTDFTSASFLNLPDTYGTILCSDEDLFCAAWASTQDGTFYFKDPKDRTCEYRTGVSLGGKTYSGWFQNGTTDFCYGSGTCSEDASVVCTDDAVCVEAGAGSCTVASGTYLRNGNESGLWHNGDAAYAGWAGACPEQADLCTEFSDPLDTAGGERAEGNAYFYLDNEKSSGQKSLTSGTSVSCGGAVSLREGCVLFEDHSNPSLLYASSPSLLVSERADRLFGGVPGSLQTPVSCPDGGRLRLADQTVVDVCTSRCAYAVSSGTSLSDVSLAVGPVKAGIATYYGRACLENRECPSVVTAAGTETSGTCETVDSAYAFQNDTNRILRISRDRTCAEWLACDSLQHAWDETRANWRTVCESVQTCNAYATSSENGFCSSWVEKEPVILNASVYSARDVSWYGLESSGYAIPNQLPIPFYRQVNIHPSTACVQKDGTPILDGETGDLVPCDANNDCSGDGGTCSEVAGDYRLAYVAGSCSGENGAACRVGFCTESGRLCNGTFDCEEGEKCTVGFCETTKPDSFCEISDDCGNGFNECHNGVCVDTKTSKDDTLETCTEDADCTLADLDGDGEADPEYTSCIPGALAKSGVCYNSSCLTGIDGNPLNLDAAEGESCRGYPDALAPFPTQIVKTWTDPSSGSGASTPSLTASDINTTDELDAIPSEYISGFPEVPTCSPVLEGSGAALTDGCVCSYDKAEYGKGAQVRYYPPGTSKDKILPGICIGGSAEGQKCENNAQCQDADGAGTDGTCGTLTGKDRFIGWKGFCIERDTSIQLFGSPNEEDRACLTWLPVDQLKGSTDMYAKSVEAGYPLADTYYCTEVGYYADLYPTGTQFDAETGLPKDNIDFACAATDASGCDWPEYGSCEKNVYCPKGYTAVVGSCDNGSLGNAEKNPTDSYCDSGDQLEDQVVASGKTMFLYEGKGRSDDCPYFCIPDGSRHLEGDDAGKSCLGDLPGFGLTNTNGTVYYKVGDLSAYQDGLSYAQKFRDCIVRGVPLAGQSEFATDWMSGDVFDGFSSGGYGYKILEDSNSPGEHYAFGLAHRSVGSLIGRCTSFSSKYPGIPSSEGIEGTPCQSSQDCPYKDSCTDPNDSGCAFTTCNKERAASGSLQVYLGCYEAAKVASLDGEMDPNKAWTNRLWENPNPDPSDPTTTLSYRTSTATDFSDEKTSYIYRPSSYATPDGRSLFEYFSNGKMAGFEKDSWPLPVEACKRDSTTQGMIGLETAPPGSCSLSMYSSYPLSAQYVQEGSTRSILNAEEAPYSYALAFPYEDISTEDEKKAMVGEIGSQDEFGRSSNKNPRGIKELLNQLFAKVYDVWQFSWNKEGGSYVSMKDEGTYGAVIGLSNGSNLTSTGDAHYDASGDGTPDPPTVVSVGSCYGTQCLEGNEGKFTVNNVDGDILEGTGSLHTVVKFYAWANPNQMPLKNVIVNWGDGDRVNSGPYTGWAWPADSYTGSIAPDNFYKNHRGLKSPGESQCDNTDWGRTSAACETAYFSFEHTYRCSNDLLESLPECRLADDGTKRLLNSPCTGGVVMGGEGECVFQPRVFVKDNWGWCTGYCNSNSEDNTEQCYGMYECSPQYCPSTGTDGNTKSGKCGDGDSGGISNPWVNFDGYILVEK